MDSQDDELLQLFLDESREHLDGIEDDLLTLEESGADIDSDLINKVFRAVHSIKGAAGFFGLTKVKDLSHAAENVFGQIRKNELVPTPDIVSQLLDAMDVLAGMINSPDTSEDEDISSYTDSLKAILDGSLDVSEKESIDEKIFIKNDKGDTIFEVSGFEFDKALKSEKGGSFYYLLEYDLLGDIERKGLTPWDVISELLQLSYFIDSKIDMTSVGTLEDLNTSPDIIFYTFISTALDPDVMNAFIDLEKHKIKQVLLDDLKNSATVQDQAETVEASAPPAPEVQVQEIPAEAIPVQAAPAEAAPVQAAPAKKAAPAKRKPKKRKSAPKVEATSVRVNVNVLDKLMTLAGEMVLTRNQLLQSVNQNEMYLVERASQRVDLITTELQDAIMSTRMQSVSIVFNKFKRIAHDMSRDLGKNIDLVLEGEDVELDKTIIEAIGDPLTHLVRNSIDHGIEMPDKRVAAGKNATGTIKLSAFHKAGQVVIEIIDDGGGINVAKVSEKALSTGLHTKEELDSMSRSNLLKLILKPGFSTAEKVTDISGRGVGMDVVYSNLSSVGGVVDISSDEGKGTTITIKLPLTLAILPSLLVEFEDQSFAIPQVNLVELQRIPATDISKRIESVGDVTVMRLRGELLPIVSLKEVFNIEETTFVNPSNNTRETNKRQNIADRRNDAQNQDTKPVEEKARSSKDRRYSSQSAINIVVVAAGDFKYGIIVDTLLDSSEIVVKPLGRHLSDCRGYAGATILGDGKAALILDIIGISQLMNFDESKDLAKKLAEKKVSETGKDIQSLLLAENAPNEVFAIPLGLVERIEKINKDQVETVAGKAVLRYREQSLMLFAIEDVAGVEPRADLETIFVVIFKIGGREAGIMVSRLVDIVEIDTEIDTLAYKQDGILGSLIISEKITLFLDLHGIATKSMPDWEMQKAETKEVEGGESVTPLILIVEDSKFFLNQISGFVSEAGYDVLTAIDGVDALNVLEQSEQNIDLILTDIEMPNLDGFELTEKIRADDRYRDIPVIAITSIMGDTAVQRGKEVGIDEYLVKLDQDQILERSKEFLKNGRPQA